MHSIVSFPCVHRLDSKFFDEQYGLVEHGWISKNLAVILLERIVLVVPREDLVCLLSVVVGSFIFF